MKKLLASTMELFIEATLDCNDNTKIPGSIVHVPRPARRAALARGWIKKCGQRDVLTIAGYKAA